MKQINCFEPSIGTSEEKLVLNCLRSGQIGFGAAVREFEQEYASYSKKKFNIGLNSASSAAYILYQMLYERCGPCRVYTTSLGFASPVWAAIKNGHEVVFIDVDENILFDIEDFKKKFIRDEKTSVAMPILYGGVSDIPGLYEAAKLLGCLVATDSAHCAIPRIKSDYIFFSFHPVKPICMSSGGMLSTNIKGHAEYFYKCRNFGRTPKGDSYDLDQSGFNFYMNSLNASLGLAQLETFEMNIQKRKRNFEHLRGSLSGMGRFVEHDESSSFYLATLVLPPARSSEEMRGFLRGSGIVASRHYPPMHTTEYYKTSTSLENTEALESRIINLPIHQGLSKKDMERIVNECIRYSRSWR